MNKKIYEKKRLVKMFYSNKKNEKILNNFLQIYKNRPIKNNVGGMQINHMFALYFLLKKIKPKFIIESGVFKGQGTWLIEKTLPKSIIYSIDINLNQRKYFSKNARYTSKDFKYFNSKIIPQKTLAFFDDHTCHFERIIQCKFFKIKHIIFEDNYIINKGDFNTLKKIMNNKNYVHKPGILSLIKSIFVLSFEIIKKIVNQNYFLNIDKIAFRLRDRCNKNISHRLGNIIKEYYEFPKILSIIKNKKLKNLLKKNYKKEIQKYNYLTYLRLV